MGWRTTLRYGNADTVPNIPKTPSNQNIEDIGDVGGGTETKKDDHIEDIGDVNGGTGNAEASQPTAGEWTRRATPDSRSPLIPDSIRSKIEAVEAEARAAGWPAELLWNCGFWDHPRGLAAVLEESDEIVEVSADAIIVLKMKRDLLRFQRRTA